MNNIIFKINSIPIEYHSNELKISFSSYKKDLENFNHFSWELAKANADPDDVQNLKQCKNNLKLASKQLKVSEKELIKNFNKLNYKLYEINT